MSESPPSEQPGEQLRKLERFLSVDPGNSRLFTDCAALAVQLEDYETLLRAANARLRLQPMDVPALAARAKALLIQGEFQRAAVEFEKVGVARPGDAAVQQDLGLCYYSLDELEWARGPFETALQLGERNGVLLRLLISTWHRLGLLADAAALAATNPTPAQTDAALAGVYARVYLDSGQVAQAGLWAKRALAMDPGNVDALSVEASLNDRPTATG
jgi:Flp pilus assembly protein TadD